MNQILTRPRELTRLGTELSPEDQKTVLACYIHRYTKTNVPRWAETDLGYTHPVQFATDDEWLAHTRFATTADGKLDRRVSDCQSIPTWPNNPELRFADTTSVSKAEAGSAKDTEKEQASSEAEGAARLAALNSEKSFSAPGLPTVEIKDAETRKYEIAFELLQMSERAIAELIYGLVCSCDTLLTLAKEGQKPSDEVIRQIEVILASARK